MPFYEQSPSDYGVRAPNLIPKPEPPPDGSLWAAGARQDNDIVAAYNYMAERGGFTYDPEHNPMDVIKDTKYEANYLHRFVDSRSGADTFARMQRIDREEGDRALLDKSGMAGVGVQVAMGFLSPTIFIPGGALYRSGRLTADFVRSAKSSAGMGAIAVSAQQAVLYGSQETRTLGESTLNVATGTILAGLLGPAIGYLTSKDLAKLTTTMDGMRKAVDADIAGQSVPDLRITPMEALGRARGLHMSADESAGAAKATREGLTLAGALGVEKLAARFSPVTRLQTSPFNTFRAGVRDIADAGLSYRENWDGVVTSPNGTLETKIKMWRGPEFAFYESLDEIYARYAFDKADVGIKDLLAVRSGAAGLMAKRGGKMTYAEFKAEVATASRNAETHDNVHVVEAAKQFRTLDESLKKASIDAGIPGFSDEMKVLGAKAHVMRLYNREKIIQHRHGEGPEPGVASWTDILLKNAQAKHGAAEAAFDARKAKRVAELEAEAADLALPDAAARTAHAAKITTELEQLKVSNPAFVQVDTQLTALRSRAGKERRAGETDAAKATQAEIRAAQKAAGDDYAAYVAARGAMTNRLRRNRTSGALSDTDRATALENARDRLSNVRSETATGLAGLQPAELAGLVDEITQSILGTSPRRIPGLTIARGLQGAHKERILDIPDRELAPFLENDIEKIARATVRSMAGDIEVAALHGDVNMTELFTKAIEEHAAMQKVAPNAAARTKLQKRFDRDMKDMELLRDRARGFDIMPANPDGYLYRAGRVALNLNYVAKLGGQTVSSIADLGRPIMRYGMLSTFRDGWLPFVTNLNSIRVVGRELRLAGTATEFIRDQRAMDLADVLGDFGRNSKFERGVQWAADRFSMATLMQPWNAAGKMIAGSVVTANVMRSAKAVARGTATQKEIARFAEDGVDEAMARRIWAHAEVHGDTVKGMHLPNTEDWRLPNGMLDTEAIQAVRAILNREVETMIVTPGFEKPRWISTPVGQILGQFKTFSLVSTQRTTLAGLQQRDGAILQGVLASMALGALAAKLKNDLRGDKGEDSSKWTKAKWVTEAMDNSGLLGVFMEANNMLEKVTRGGVGMSNTIAKATGEEPKQISRYASRNIFGAMGGPTVDALADFMTLGAAINPRTGAKWSAADTHALRKVIPAQNLFFLRGLFDKAEQGINSSLNIPAQRPRH